MDALQVDLYDQEAAGPVFDSAEFYAHCRSTLTPEGCMTVNLFGHKSSFQRSVTNMEKAFGKEALWAFKATREGNTVVLAQRTPSRPKRAELLERADTIRRQWGLPADKWVRGFKPVYRMSTHAKPKAVVKVDTQRPAGLATPGRLAGTRWCDCP